MGQISRGMYTTACEASPHKQDIDIWLNEGKSNAFISRQLKLNWNEEISDKSVAKYRAYRDEYIKREMENDPVYQGKMMEINDRFIEGVGKIKQVDVLAHLANTIEDCADMIQDAKDRDVQIKSVQDMRFMQMTMLDAIKLYGDTMLKAQRFNAVNENPELLQPKTININVKAALTDILKGVMNGGTGGYELIDKLRNGISTSASVVNDIGGGVQGDSSVDRSDIVDGDKENAEG